MNIVLTFTPAELDTLQAALTAAANRFSEKSRATEDPSMKRALQTMIVETDAVWSRVFHAMKRVTIAA